MNENFKAYRVGAHKHIPEIEEVANSLVNQARWGSQPGGQPGSQLKESADLNKSGTSQLNYEKLMIDMVPHLVPMTRGILSTIYVDMTSASHAGELTEDQLRSIYEKAYGDSTFIRLLAPGKLPETKQVSGTNFCDIALHLDKRTKRLIIITAIDNLLKGASGQAVQNMNLMMGLKEETGLMFCPMYL